jgi:O-antigen/teichoic acid export membrane protein
MKGLILKINNSELLKGSFTAFFFRGIGILGQYVFLFLLAQIYGAEAVGIFSIIFIVLQLSGILSRLGTDNAMLKFAAEFTAKGDEETLDALLKQSYLITIIISLFISIIVFIESDFIAINIFSKESLDSHIKIVALGITPFSLLFINNQFLRGLKKIALFMILQSGLPFFIASIVLIVSTLGWQNELTIVAKSIVIAFSITFIISLFVINRYFKLKVAKPQFFISQKLLSVALPLMMVSTVAYMMGWIDTIILGIFNTETEVGIYNICLKIAAITSLPLVAVNSIAAPKFAEYWGKGDIRGIEKTAKSSTKLILLTSTPLLLLILFFPSFILNFFGAEFKVGYKALSIVAIAQFISALSGSVGFLLQMTKYQILYRNVIIIATVINVVLSFLLVPSLGVEGAAIATSVCLVFWNISSVIIVKRKFNFWVFRIF